MTPDSPDVTVENQPERHRYEVTCGGTLAGLMTYRQEGEQLDLVHTEILPEYEGKGLAAQLVARALDDVRARGQLVVPSCSYVAKFVQRHPQYQDLQAPGT